MNQDLNKVIDNDRLTTVTEFSHLCETKTNGSPDKIQQQPVLKLLEKTPEGETMVYESSNHESNPEIQEFKMIEKMV